MPATPITEESTVRPGTQFHRLLTVIICLGLLLQTSGLAWGATAPAYYGRVDSASLAHRAESLALPPTEPAPFNQPLSVVRTQSSFTGAGGALVITYTVRNNLSPQQLPDVPPGATPEQIVAALAAFDPTSDPHTLHNVILVAAPTANSTIQGSSQPASVADNNFVFLLGNLPPQASATLIVTATTLPSVSAATPLVNATGWASLAGEAVSAAAAPALVLPPAFGDWLIRTMDADTEDEEMLQALARTGGDPAAIFALVRGFGFEAYRGSLRGTRGTLWSGAGNSLDQSSLLIAMLRASGIPARYRHGALNQANAKTLIASMFPTPTTVLGHVAPEVPVSDPVNDAALIAEVQDHWWVEAHIDGAWTDLDPSFANATVGQRFTEDFAADGTDRSAEAPDAARPKVTIKLNVERYNQLNVGGMPQTATYLNHTFRVVEVATASVVFANHVTSEGQGGLVFSNKIHTYAPFLHIDDKDEIIWGDPYQEILTNFPLATTFITGAWLLFEVQDLDGNVTTYQRTLRDRLGYDIRTYGGSPDIALDGSSPGIFSEFDLYSISFFPGVVPTAVFEARRAGLTNVLFELANDAGRMQELAGLTSLSAAQQAEASQIRARYQLNLGLFLNSVSMNFAEVADRASQISQAALFVKAYHDDPRLVILSHEVVDNGTQFNMDLRTTLERTIAHPGQGEPATFGFNLFKGINESWLEGQVLAAAANATVLTTAQVMQAASEQEIEFVFISATNLDLLATISLSAEATARITTAVLNGKIVNLPITPPLIDGEPAMGWWEIDPDTGETIGVMQNGLHNALIEFVGNLIFSTTVGRIADFMIGATAATWDFVGQRFFKATGSGDFGTPAKDALGKTNQGLGCLLKDVLTCLGISKGYLDYGYMAMEAYLNYQNQNDPPLTDLLLGNAGDAPVPSSAGTVLSVAANLSGSAIAADLQTSFTQLADTEGGLSFYAAALDPLASGSSGEKTALNHVNNANLTLDAARLQLTPSSGTVTVGGQPLTLSGNLALANFSGSLEITAIAPATDRAVLNGSGVLFALATNPASSVIAPVDTAQFNVDIATTFSGSFNLNVSAPEGWQVEISNAGQVTVTPPAGAAPADYTLLVMAQSATFPDLLLATAHTVTVTPYDGLLLNLRPDPLTTVPMGAKLDNSGFINTGQAQVPGAAYIIELSNISNAPHTYTVNVGGLPGGWTLLGGKAATNTTVALPAGATAQIGLYVTPDSLPAAGTTHPINVSATADNGTSANASGAFVMPAVPFSYVQVTPATQAITKTATAIYDVTVRNVGNAAGSFNLLAEAINFDNTVSFGALPAPVNIPAGDSATFPVSVSTDEAPVLRSVVLAFGSPVANTEYTPTALAELRVISAESEPFLNAANRCELTPTVDAALLSLLAAVGELVYWCDQGDCPPVLRNRVVTAGEAVVAYATSAVRPISLPTLAPVESALSDLAGQSSDSAILAAVASLGAAVYELSGELCQVEGRRASARFTPYVEAILLGEMASFYLAVTNQGRLATTYDITVSGAPGGDLTFDETIAPGETANLPVEITPAALGVYGLTATVSPVDPELTVNLTRQATARLNVVDKFVQVLRVSADPAFVETGASSTSISVEIANVAGVPQPVNARTAVLAPDGASLFNDDIPLTVLAGNPRSYALAAVDTSGWAAGVYSITVDLLDAAEALVPDGAGHGYFSAGQALAITSQVTPEIVAPGTVTATTLITSRIRGDQLSVSSSQLSVSSDQLAVEGKGITVYDAPLSAADERYLTRGVEDLEVSVGGEGATEVAAMGVQAPAAKAAPADLLALEIGQPLVEETMPLTPFYSDGEEASVQESAPSTSRQAAFATLATSAFTRLEQDDPAIIYTGTWTNQNQNQASGASYLRNATAGSTATLTFDGSWLNIGFMGTHFGGQVEIHIDGNSQGIFDLYRREDNTPMSFVFPNLGSGSHTVSMTLLSSKNAFSLGTRVQLDYLDYGDGSALADGVFEQDDPRVILSNGWTSVTYANASGGSYVRSAAATAWFPFSGDSFSLTAIAYNAGGRARLFVDGQYLDTIDLYHPNSSTNAVSRTFSYAGFGPGTHILQVMTYRDTTTIDALTTPGQAPFVDPNPPVSGVTRVEADDSVIRYNGVPFTQTAQSWARVANINSNRASDGEYIYSPTAGDTISFDFDGSWLGVGFATDRFSGQAEIAIDGQPVQMVDLYSRTEDTASYYFNNLGSGPHTVTITVLGTRHPNSSNNRVHLDFFEVWDGAPLATGTFEEDNSRLFYGSSWSRTLNGAASGGAYGITGLNVNSTLWFPFTGDSVTYQAWASSGLEWVEVRINGVSQGKFYLYSLVAGPRSFSFDGLGSGPHVMEIRLYRSNATVDAFVTPATGEHYEQAAPSGVIRLEEDHPNLRYNGYPAHTMPQSWSFASTLRETSGGWRASSNTVGNTLSLDFDGTFVGAGFQSSGSSGVVEIFIDGISRGTFNTAGGAGNVSSIYFDDLAEGSHTISVTVVSGTVMPDFIDIWDGQTTAGGWYNGDLEDYSGRFHFSYKGWWTRVTSQYALEGDYLSQTLPGAHPNMWFTFVGSDLSILGFNRAGAILDITIDGQNYGEFDMTATYSNQPYALHFADLGDGPHVVQIHTRNWGYVDAFEVNPDGFYSYTPEITWHDASPAEVLGVPGFYDLGMVSTVAIGDLNGDGIVELVAPSTNGRIYVYRGDGVDTGNGTPILWTTDAVGVAAEPALADLTGDGMAEIIVCGFYGAFAFRHDGSQLWQNDAVKCFSQDPGPKYFGWGGPTIGNLDDDPDPEIVIAASDNALYVLDHQGNILDSDPIGNRPGVPLLADITSDGRLNIVAAQGHTLKVYDYDALNGLEIVWSYTLTNTTLRSGVFGSPAVADITGDGQPEIIINWGHRVEALTADGSLLWSYYTGSDSHFRPSPITVADTTGDGQVNIITASAINAGFLVFNHLLMVLNADGTPVWQQEVADNTASASGVAAQDLTGNGVWEVLWNGAVDGFLVIRGTDGKRLFNEPVTGSGTIIEYPALGDVDGDGVADVVVAGFNGIYVISHVGRWIDSRPLWNQHNYHVTNINDNWSVPVNQPNSWEIHNTYRTQTPERTPAPSYSVEITHTVDLDNVIVLADSFSTLPTGTPPLYHWAYQLEWYDPVNTISFDSELINMQPGKTRQINQGTEVAYRLPSGMNYLTLPPLYVTAAHLGELSPPAQSVVIGGTAVFTLTLTNPGSVADSYALAVGGLPAAWVSFPATVPLLPGETTEVLITVTAPPGAEADMLPLLVDITNQSGGVDNLQASLTVFEGVKLAITPASQTTQPGVAVTYTLTLTNYEPVARTYALTATSLAAIDLPADLTVAAGETETHTITVTPVVSGPHPFTVEASAPSGATGSDDAVLEVTATAQAALRLSPDPLVTGPGSTGIFSLLLSNLGEQVETFELEVELPAGWSYRIEDSRGPISRVTLPPFVFNTIELMLLVTPNVGATIGDYPATVRTVAQSSDAIAGSTTGTVQVIDRGVQIQIGSGPGTIDPKVGGSWNVLVTNTGAVADTFRLGSGGLAALAASLSASTVTLNPGQSQAVQLTMGALGFVAPQSYLMSVSAVSESDARIADDDTTTVTVAGHEALSLSWEPATQTVEESLTADLTLLIRNMGNVSTRYSLGISGGGLTSRSAQNELLLPPGSEARLPVTVSALLGGTYTLNATADSLSSNATASAAATVTFVIPENQPPIVNAGPDQMVNVGHTVQFSGSASDPDGDALATIQWNFGDNTTATGSLTPSHVYTAAGVYTVVLTVTDSRGGTAADSLTVTVNTIVPVNRPPVVDAGPNQTVKVGDTVQFTGSASDPDGDALATIQWNFGDNTTATGSLTPSHIYTAVGVYTVVLSVTDSRGATGSDSLTVTVQSVVAENQPPIVDAGPNQTVKVGDTVQFTGSASDPDGDTLATIQWNFGDNTTASGSLTPNHVYTAVGVYTVVLSVTDSRGATGSDSLTVTVSEPGAPPVEFPIFLPLIQAQGTSRTHAPDVEPDFELYLPMLSRDGTVLSEKSESEEE
jgi:uncharacterized membrane protein/PKD repeat protein